MTPPSIVLLGVGNVLMSDEGVGVHAVTALERDYDFSGDVRCVDGGTSTNELLGDVENVDHLIIIDAVIANRPPGTIVRLEDEEVPTAFTTKLSPHQVGISDLLATLTLLGRAPKHVVLLGVEPARLTLDLALSAPVAAIFPELCRRVLAELTLLGVRATPRAPGAAPGANERHPAHVLG